MSGPVRLEIDAGNSSVKWRLMSFASRELCLRGVINWEDVQQSSFDFLKAWDLEEVLFASVADEAKTSAMLSFIYEHGSCSSFRQIVSRKRLADVTFAYPNIEKLGVDRCLAMVASYNKTKEAVLVVDAGSAITADFVDQGGQHRGGYIFPGLRLLRDSLLSGTAKVPVSQSLGLGMDLGRDTEDCVAGAVNLMLYGGFSELLSKSKEMGVSRICFTGGSGRWLMALLGAESAEFDPDLVLDGLLLVRNEGVLLSPGSWSGAE